MVVYVPLMHSYARRSFIPVSNLTCCCRRAAFTCRMTSRVLQGCYVISYVAQGPSGKY